MNLGQAFCLAWRDLIHAAEAIVIRKGGPVAEDTGLTVVVDDYLAVTLVIDYSDCDTKPPGGEPSVREIAGRFAGDLRAIGIERIRIVGAIDEIDLAVAAVRP